VSNFANIKELKDWFSRLTPEDKKINGQFFNQEKARLGPQTKCPDVPDSVKLGPRTARMWMQSRRIHYWHVICRSAEPHHEILIEEIIGEGVELESRAAGSFDLKFVGGKLIRKHLIQTNNGW
jgi:hypothetical protein